MSMSAQLSSVVRKLLLSMAIGVAETPLSSYLKQIVRIGELKMYFGRIGCVVTLLSCAGLYGFCGDCITNNGTIYQIARGNNKIVAVSRVKSNVESNINLRIPNKVIGYDVQGIAEGAFSYDNAIRFVYIEDGLWRIGDDAFRGCSALESVSLPESLLVLGHKSFMGCSKLQEIRLPGRLTGDSGSLAFKDCDNLRRVIIADELSCDIVPFFYECAVLNEFVVGSNRMYRVIDSCLYDNTGDVFIKCPVGLLSSNFHVRAGVKSIADCAFFSCRNLQHVVLPGTLREIGAAAFCNSALEEIVIPEGVETIGMEAFAGCANLNSVKLPRSTRYIGINCFAKSKGLRKIVFMGARPEIEGRDVSIGATNCEVIVSKGAKGWLDTGTLWGMQLKRVSPVHCANMVE